MLIDKVLLILSVACALILLYRLHARARGTPGPTPPSRGDSTARPRRIGPRPARPAFSWQVHIASNHGIDARRDRRFDNYITQSVERDVLELARIRERQLMREVLELLARRTAQVLDISKAMAGLTAARNTLDNHVRLLEDLFLVNRLPAWGTTLSAEQRRLRKSMSSTPVSRRGSCGSHRHVSPPSTRVRLSRLVIRRAGSHPRAASQCPNPASLPRWSRPWPPRPGACASPTTCAMRATAFRAHPRHTRSLISPDTLPHLRSSLERLQHAVTSELVPRMVATRRE